MTFPPGAGAGREAGEDVSRALSIGRASAVPRRGCSQQGPVGGWKMEGVPSLALEAMLCD